MNFKKYIPNLDGNNLNIGIIQSRFNEEICNTISNSAIKKLIELNTDIKKILLVTVPGALEIPIILQKFAILKKFDALIAIGAVIQGETYSAKLISNINIIGINQISLKFQIPIVNALLYTKTNEQALLRMKKKGNEAALTAIEIANLNISLNNNNLGLKY